MSNNVPNQDLLAEMESLFETLIQTLTMECDERGPFDPLKEPERMFALYEKELQVHRALVQITARALAQVLPEEGVTVDTSDIDTPEAKVQLFWTEPSDCGQRGDTHREIDFRVLAMKGEETAPPATEVSARLTSEEDYRKAAADVQTEIVNAGFYVDLYRHALKSNNVTGFEVATRCVPSTQLAAVFSVMHVDLPEEPSLTHRDLEQRIYKLTYGVCQ